MNEPHVFWFESVRCAFVVVIVAFVILIALLFAGCAPARTVRFVAQGDRWDCGPACLTMLGYPGYDQDYYWASYPGVLAQMQGVREIVPGTEAPDRTPHMLVVRWPGRPQEHWVIAYRDSIYDPVGGVRSERQWAYSDSAVVVQELVVPFAKEKQ